MSATSDHVDDEIHHAKENLMNHPTENQKFGRHRVITLLAAALMALLLAACGADGDEPPADDDTASEEDGDDAASEEDGDDAASEEGDDDAAEEEGDDADATAAGDYPSGDIRFLVPYGAGGGTDLLVRTVAPYLEEILGTTVIVENMPGGSGSIAMQEVIGSEPDGHTLTTVNPGPAIVAPLASDVGYTKDDYGVIANMASAPLVLTVPPDSPYDDAQALFEAARENPGTVTIATPGATVSQTIELALLQREEGVEFTLVPFNGGSEVVTAVLGSQVDAALTSEPDIVSQVEGGQLVALGTTADERTDFLPDVPTFVEQGIEPASAVGPYGVAISPDTPQEIRDILEDAVRQAIEDEDLASEIRELGLTPLFIGSEEFRGIIDETSDLYESVLSDVQDLEVEDGG